MGRNFSIDPQSLVKKYGSPLFVYSENELFKPVAELQKGLSKLPHLICFAVKANSNLFLLKKLGEAGLGADVVSGGELLRALRAGMDSRKIVFSGVGKTRDEIRLGLNCRPEGIYSFNVESIEELIAINSEAQVLKKEARVALRFNPDIDAKTHPYISTGLKQNKFGLSRKEIHEALSALKKLKHVKTVGLSIHIGSQILSLSPLKQAFHDAKQMYDEVTRELKHPLEFLDLGGGVGVQYMSEKTLKIPDYCSEIEKLFSGKNALTHQTRIVLEPGRLIAANAGLLLTTVTYKKVRSKKTFLITDAGMNDLIRPALYQAKHQIISFDTAKLTSNFAVVGPVCETSDSFSDSVKLPHNTDQGSILGILSAGAYGSSMASQYNSRARPAEIWLGKDGSDRLIRRRENFSDLIAPEEDLMK